MQSRYRGGVILAGICAVAAAAAAYNSVSFQSDFDSNVEEASQHAV